ncbi:FAD-binding oxidoreductase [Chlamydiia bacterium]|nr:FAD-binding oxidoreductase [Chlamydiia bacterium]
MRFYKHKRYLSRVNRDASGYHQFPRYVVYPRNVREIQMVLRSEKSCDGVTIRAGGTGLGGACLGKNIVCHVKHLKRTKYESRSKYYFEAGANIKTIRQLVQKNGHYFPSAPFHGKCCLSGVINTRAVGPYTYSFGYIDSYIDSMVVVLADGTVVDTSKPLTNNIEMKLKKTIDLINTDECLKQYIFSRPISAGGFNLKSVMNQKTLTSAFHHLMIGSVGQLGVLVSVRMTLPKMPLKGIFMLYPYQSFDHLNSLLLEIHNTKPFCIELLDREVADRIINTTDQALGYFVVHHQSAHDCLPSGKVLLEDGFLEKRSLALKHIFDEAMRHGLWIPSFLDDVSIHPKHTGEVLHDIDCYMNETSRRYCLYGHPGIGSLHLRVFLPKDQRDLEPMALDIFKIVNKYGGTMVGEHNLGFNRSWYLFKEREELFQLHKKIKTIFDPDYILANSVLKKRLQPYPINVKETLKDWV